MSGVNKLILLGRVGRDPEIRLSGGGMAIANFSVATSSKHKGEEITQWHNCVAFDKTAELIEKYVNKGDQVYVEGQLNYEQYEKDGVKMTSAKVMVNAVQFLGGGKGRQDSDRSEQREERPAQRQQSQAAPDAFDDSDDIPFANPYRGSFLLVI